MRAAARARTPPSAMVTCSHPCPDDRP
jgi:hypothetical protein